MYLNAAEFDTEAYRRMHPALARKSPTSFCKVDLLTSGSVGLCRSDDTRSEGVRWWGGTEVSVWVAWCRTKVWVKTNL